MFQPTLQVNNTDIFKNLCNVTLNEDEFTLTKTGNNAYFGKAGTVGKNYSEENGELIDIGSASVIYLLLTNSLMNKNVVTFYDANKVCLSISLDLDYSCSINIPANTKYVSIRFGNLSEAIGTIIKTKLMVSLESGTFEPYVGGQASPSPLYPQPIKSVVGEIKNKIQNKNLAWTGWAEDCVSRINNINHARIEVKDNRNCLKISAAAGYGDYDNKYIFKTNFKENTQYTFCFDFLTDTSTFSYGNFSIYYSDGTNQTIAKVNNNNWNKFIVTSALNKTIKYITPYYTSGNRYIDLDTFMVLEGVYTEQTIPDYVPHAEQNLPFTLEEGEKLFSGDTLEDDGKHHRRGQHIIANNNVYSLITLNNENKAIVVGLPNKKITQTNLLYCNKAIFSRTLEEGTFYENPSNIVIVGNPNDTLETLKEKYVGAIIEYKLEEEEIVPYNSTQQDQYNTMKQAMSYDDVTYITSTSDELPPILEVQYWKKKVDAEVITPSENENKVEFVDELPDSEDYINLDEIENQINPIEVESEVIEDETNN